ncbi:MULTISPECIES: DUF5677 domain-containing protein [unclassified Paenibacillus]|uniref:DUF5677 domain-containing protein n=1 Tax=unclassified Paenibacillus TaxID=185978 RepID=UPI000708947C|nr:MULTISPECIES: DUF5677 domain-containing protein [unclassified Paenibacillus]KQX48761.1 hypothetical protein ASD40_11355 [Paenibacillus sp. Root444D2]KRE36379.1 hypothetical protein ASG85_09380 [Paenibacillus sp. Soil724D2]
MYNKEVVMEMKSNHWKLLKFYDDWVELIDLYLIEEQIPHNLLSHLSSYFITRFHKSKIALRLLLVSGFCDEAYSVLRMMVEYTITLKFIIKNPEERVFQFIDDTGLVREDEQNSDILTMANETKMQYWFNSVYMPYSSCMYPHLSTDLGELFLPAGPVPFNADDMLTKSCHLAAIILGCALETNPNDNELSKTMKNKLDLLLVDMNGVYAF